MNVISVLGGKVHTRQDFDGGEDFFFPLCRTGDMTNRGTKYRGTEAEVTCTVCLSYGPAQPETAPQEEAFFAPEEAEAYLIGEKKQDQKQDQAAPVTTREDWLHQAIDALRPDFEAINFPLPKRVHISVGFGYGAKRESLTTLGECWSSHASEDRVNHIFISPEIKDARLVLATLVHELVHAADDCKSGHKGAFAKHAKALGLTGKMTATVAGPDLAEKLVKLAKSIGPYPHAALHPMGVPARPKPEESPEGTPEEETPEEETPVSSGPKKQGTRMIKVKCSEECECGGYIIRTTQKWIEVGMPVCPMGTVMEVA